MPNPMPMSGNCDVVRIWDGHSNSQEANNHVSEQNEQPINNAANQINNITNNISNETVKDNVTNIPVQEPTNIGIPELNPNDLGLPRQDVTPINNMSTDILGLSKEEEHKATFNIGIEESNNISNPSLDILNNKQETITPNSNNIIPEININNSNETL